ncbi:c-type cytochrome [Frateuria aurantia]
MKSSTHRLSRRQALLLAGIGLSLSGIAAAQSSDGQDVIQRGQYLTRAADCVVCHTAEGGRPFAGGLAFKTPFGTMYSSNITPDADTGIGQWSEQDFDRAVRHGIRKDGAHLYPSMPYTSYVKLTDADVHAIRAYLMSLPAVKQSPPPNKMGFPYNQRWSLKAWNLLNFKDQGFHDTATQSAAWNRGAYVEQALGHCEECHTPRNLTMGLKHNDAFAGAMVDGWQAYNISPDPIAGIGSWSSTELARYLSTGSLPGKASAGGAMADVISHSLRYLSQEDMADLVLYLRSRPPQSSGAAARNRFSWGQATDDITQQVRGIDPGKSPDGAMLFNGNCAACHALDGHGIGQEHYYPSLFHNSTVGAATPNNLVQVILHGIHRVNGQDQPIVMPGFADQLDDAEIATLSNYLTAHFGNPQVTVDASTVGQLRAAEVKVIPGWLLVAGGAAASLLILLAIAWQVRRKRH